MQKTIFAAPDQPVSNPGLWDSESVNSDSWHVNLNSELIDELSAATRQVITAGLSAPNFQAEQFNAPLTRDFLSAVSDQLENGRGFVVLRGIDRDSYSQIELEALFWGLGLLLGTAVPINADGALLGHVTDLGFDLNNPKVRNYQTREELSFHNDSCDVLGLMCLCKAKSGGGSAIASAIAIHNEILNSRPDLLHELYQPMPIDRRGELGWPGEGDSPWFALPVFSIIEGKVTARYTVHDYYYQSQRFADAPRIGAVQREALEYLKQVSLDSRYRINFELEPGDIQLVNNYCVFHSRTRYEDYPEPERKRHLLRLWLSVANSRRLHPVFQQRYRSAEPGAIRGGIAPAAAMREQ